MIDWQALPLYVVLPACFAGGLALGFAYFRVLRVTVDLLLRGHNPLLGLALTLGRLAVIGIGFYLVVRIGGLALLAAFAGVLVAKMVMLRQARGADA